MRMSQYKNIFARGYTPKWSGKDFEMTKVKSTVALTYVMKYLNSEEINGINWKINEKKVINYT